MGAPAIVLGFIGRTVLSVAIVAVFVLFFGPAKQHLAALVGGMEQWQGVRDHVREARQSVGTQVAAAERQLNQLRSGSVQQVEATLERVQNQLEETATQPRLVDMGYLDLAQMLARRELNKALDAEVRWHILQQERDALKFLLQHLNRAASIRESEQKEAHRRQESLAANAREDAARKNYQRYEADLTCRIPLSSCAKALDHLREANKAAHKAYDEWEKASTDLKKAKSELIPLPPAFRVDSSQIQGILAAMEREVSRIGSWQVTAIKPLVEALKKAAYIVVGAIATIVAIKGILFFVLAPLAERRPPLVVRPTHRPGGRRPASRSSLTLPMALSPSDVLVILGSHLQSTPDSVRARTQWLLSAAKPLTSLASGMWMLTRLQSSAPCTVVVSAATDPLEEIGALTLNEGDALVIQPRYLVGVAHPADRPLRMRSEWKGGWHAWLTLQFRYLVIEGPGTLIVRGCRGTRVEDADQGRRISQAMTIGFSPHLAYSVSRTETFASYLLGQRPLFIDRLHGPGIVLYQEVPSAGMHTGMTGRGLEGLLDGALKAVGI